MPSRVLLVEDDALSLKLMRDILHAHGFETSEVSDGSEVLERAAAFGPDIVVMDIGLPGLSGVEATRLLKSGEPTRHVPVMAVTAFAMPDDERRMREAGCDAFLTKPLKLQEFVETVKALIAKAVKPS